MNIKNITYTQEEIEILKEYKTIENLKTQKNIYLKLFIFDLIMIFANIIWFIVNFNFYSLMNTKHKIITVAIVFFSFAIKKCLDGIKIYDTLILKYELILDNNLNPFIMQCNSKMTNCKSILAKTHNYYTLNKHYTDLSFFLKKYKNALPILLFEEAETLLKNLESEMLKCNL